MGMPLNLLEPLFGVKGVKFLTAGAGRAEDDDDWYRYIGGLTVPSFPV